MLRLRHDIGNDIPSFPLCCLGVDFPNSALGYGAARLSGWD